MPSASPRNGPWPTSSPPVTVSFGSGWNGNDFVFFPERYETRREIMYEQIDTIRALWWGEPMTRKNTFGKEMQLTLYPKPVQPQLPIWITSLGKVATFRSAEAWDANVLTHMITQDIYILKDKISVYRRAPATKGLDPLQRCRQAHAAYLPEQYRRSRQKNRV